MWYQSHNPTRPYCPPADMVPIQCIKCVSSKETPLLTRSWGVRCSRITRADFMLLSMRPDVHTQAAATQANCACQTKWQKHSAMAGATASHIEISATAFKPLFCVLQYCRNICYNKSFAECSNMACAPAVAAAPGIHNSSSLFLTISAPSG